MKKYLSTLLALALILSAVALAPASAEAEEPYSFTLMANFGQVPTSADQAFLKYLNETLNLDIQMVTPAASAYDESLQLMVASGEYCDLVLYLSHTSKIFVDAVTSGLYLPLNDLLKDCPDLTAHSYQVSWDTLQILGDGNIYGVPRTSIARADGYSFRKDWFDALDLSFEFTDGDYLTVDQLWEMLYAFTYNDPDGNGANDTYGLGTYAGSGTMAPLLAWTFGLNGWQEYDGEYMDLKWSREADNYKQCLEFTNRLWEAGLVDPDWPTIDNIVQDDRFYAGITGMRTTFPGHIATALTNGRAINPNYDLYFTPGVVREEGDAFFGGSFSTGFWGLWAVSSFAEQPEKIMGMLNYLLSDEGWKVAKYGVEGVTWTEENGVIASTDQYTMDLMNRAFLRRNDDAAFFVSLALTPEERAQTEYRIQLCIDQCRFPLDGGFRPTISDDPTFIDYEKYMNIEIAKIITGDRPVEDWDELLDGWYAAGGEQYVEEMRAFIAANNA